MLKKISLSIITTGFFMILASCSMLPDGAQDESTDASAQGVQNYKSNIKKAKADVTTTNGLGQTVSFNDPNAIRRNRLNDQSNEDVDKVTADQSSDSRIRKGSSNAKRSVAYNPHEEVYYFSFDSSLLHAKDINEVKQVAKYLLHHNNAHVLLAGNTDERGSREYNIALGERRAKSVADELRVAGVHPRQIRIVSYGQEKPVALGHNEAAWRMNRRVELTYEAIA